MALVLSIMGVAFLLDACFGFGGAWVAVPLLSLLMPPKDAVFLMLVFQCVKVGLLIQAWRHIKWKSLNFLFVGMFLGLLIGISILNVVSPALFRLGLAVYLLVYVGSEYVQYNFSKIKWFREKRGALLAGLAGGVISGVTGMGAPPYITYLRTLGLDKLSFRATIIFVLGVSTFFRLIMDFREITQNDVVVTYFWPCLGLFVVLSLIGSHIPKFMSEKVFKHSINGLLLGSALMLIYKSLF